LALALKEIYIYSGSKARQGRASSSRIRIEWIEHIWPGDERDVYINT
jgi:hypothetical protein